MIDLSADCCAYAARTYDEQRRRYDFATRECTVVFSFVPDICDLRVSLICGVFLEFARLYAFFKQPSRTIDDPFILNQMVQNEGRIQEMEASGAIKIANLNAVAASVPKSPETLSVSMYSFSSPA